MTEKEPDYLVSVQYRIAMYCVCVRNCMITTCAIVGKDSAESFILVCIYLCLGLTWLTMGLVIHFFPANAVHSTSLHNYAITK